MKIWLLRSLIGISCFYMAVGCATIMHGTTQNVLINSKPDDAEIWVDGARSGRTPASINLDRDSKHFITVKKEGYKESDFIINQETSGWLVGNIIFGGLVGCVIDLSNGGAYDLSPEWVSISLTDMNELDELAVTEKAHLIATEEETYPAFLTLELYDGETKYIDSEKVALTYSSFGWTESLLTADGITGISTEMYGPFKNNSINFSKGDILYMQIDSTKGYKIEVVQEKLKKLTLELIKLM